MADASAALPAQVPGLREERARSLRVLLSVLRFVRRKPLGAFGGLIMLVLLLLALFGHWVAPFHYADIDVFNRFIGPTSEHPFGTDDQGRDVLSRVIFGARASVIIGLGAVIIATIGSSIIGIVSGYYGGTFDLFAQRLIDAWQAFPGLIFVIFIISVITSTVPRDSTASQISMIVTIGILFTAGASRVVRSQTISTKQNDFVEAAQALGASDLRILTRHIFPNVVTVIIVNISIQIGFVILIESTLSFLGFGVQPPFPSWGRMLQEAQAGMQQHPYLALFPGVAIALTVYSLNMFGDALRDVLDPRLRGAE